jgi:hypothetical protein
MFIFYIGLFCHLSRLSVSVSVLQLLSFILVAATGILLAVFHPLLFIHYQSTFLSISPFLLVFLSAHMLNSAVPTRCKALNIWTYINHILTIWTAMAARPVIPKRGYHFLAHLKLCGYHICHHV